METLQATYDVAKENDGALGSAGVTFEAIEERGVAQFLAQIQDELTRHTYVPIAGRKKGNPKARGQESSRSVDCHDPRDS